MGERKWLKDGSREVKLESKESRGVGRDRKWESKRNFDRDKGRTELLFLWSIIQRAKEKQFKERFNAW